MKIWLICALAAPLLGQPKFIDVHVHHNGQAAFLDKLVTRLESLDAMAFLLVPPADFDAAHPFVNRHPRRLVGFCDLDLDDPKALDWVERCHKAGFRGLGEISSLKGRYDDPRYHAVYERAEKHRMILLFHTGVKNRPNPDVPADISVDRMRAVTLDLIARRFPRLTIIGAHLGNPEYAWAAEMARWNPNLYWDLSGSTLIKTQNDYTVFRGIFWWSSVVSPHTPKSDTDAFERVVFASDVFGGELEELDRSLERYRNMLLRCKVGQKAQDNIFAGTMWRILNAR